MNYVWNSEHTGLINLDKVRNLELLHDEYGVGVIAWISDNESIQVGRFDTEEEARIFLHNIVKKYNRRKGYEK